MTKTISSIIILYFHFPLFLFSQTQAPVIDFSIVDSFSKKVKYKKSVFKLTDDLTKPYLEPTLKARAIFIWITENIRYDYKYYNKHFYKGKEPKTYKCKEGKDCEGKKIIWETKYIEKALRKRKAICQGYSMLFKKMCNIAGLKSEIIPGYVRTEYYQVGTAGSLDHAWNVIWLDSSYHLLDATWAAGGCAKNDDGKLLFYKKNFNNYYWLTPSINFARNHYPQDPKWVLLSNYNKDSFITNPYYLSSELDKIKLITPNSGIISAQKGDTIQFKIEYTGSLNQLQINTNLFRNPDIWTWKNITKRKKIKELDTSALKRQQYVLYQKKKSFYEFNHIVSDNSLYYLDILFDFRRVLRFKVNTERQQKKPDIQ